MDQHVHAAGNGAVVAPLHERVRQRRHALHARTGGETGHRGNPPGAFGRIDVLSMRTSSGDDLLAHATNDPSLEHDNTQLRTPMPTPVQPGRTVEIAAVAFRTTLPDAFARSGAWNDFAFVGQWFPKIAVLDRDGQWAHFPFHANTEFFADFGRYDVMLEVPHGDIVGASGREVGSVVEARAGDRYHYIADAVHDFAWTSWREFRERTDVIDGVSVRTLFPPGAGGVASRAIDALGWTIPDYRERFGTYPYPNLTVVVPPRQAHGVGGMEYPTLITVDGEWWEPSNERSIEWTTAHEYAHQYFYGVLASDEWSWPFLDEGFADYASGLAMGDRFGVDREFWDGLGFTLGYWAFEGGLAADIHDNIPIARDSSECPDYFSYAQHVYRRAATVLRTAERSFGRAAMRRMLELYTARTRFRHPTPGDLLAAARDGGAPGLEPFLRHALLDNSNLDITLTDSATVQYSGAAGLTVEVSERRADGTVRRTAVHDTPAETAVARAGTSGVARVVVDPSERLPLDRNRLDNAKGAATRGTWTAFESLVAFGIECLARALGP